MAFRAPSIRTVLLPDLCDIQNDLTFHLATIDNPLNSTATSSRLAGYSDSSRISTPNPGPRLSLQRQCCLATHSVENRSMKPRHNRSAFSFVVNASAKSLLSVLLSTACIFTLGIDLPAPAANTAPADSIPAKDKKPKQDPVLKGLPITELSADEAILHALNRLAYGPRPGDIERVRQMGLAKWIDQQLNPNSIDDKAVEARLDAYPTLRMSSKQLLADYPQQKQVEKKAEKQAQTRGDAAAAVVARDMRHESGSGAEELGRNKRKRVCNGR